MGTVIAQAYQWLDGDTIAASSTSDAGAPYALANVKDPNLLHRGRTTDDDDGSGFTFALTTSQNVTCFEAVNIGHVSVERFSFRLASSATYDAGFLVINTASRASVLSEVYTQHNYLYDVPARTGWVVGHDNFSPTGPSPSAAVATVSVQSGLLTNFTSTASGRTYWEIGYLGLGINAQDIQSPTSVQSERIELRHGYGWRMHLHWDNMPRTDYTHLDDLQASTHSGSLPCFVYPDVGSRPAAAVFTDSATTPAVRGGLVRLLECGSHAETKDLRNADYVSDVRLVCETWQEQPVSEGV